MRREDKIMAKKSLFLEEARSILGKEKQIGEPMAVERGAIKKFIEAIRDRNPLYQDEQYARKRGYNSVVAPPTFVGREPPTALIPNIPEEAIALHASDDWEFLRPVEAGDLITRNGKLTNVYEKQGRTGSLVLFNIEITYTNQRSEVVAIYRPTEVFRF